MNILIDKLPTTLIINGQEYEINSDFRVSILFELLMLDDEVSRENKLILALQLYYKECPKAEDIDEAIKQMLWFYKCGKEDKKIKGNSNNSNSNVEAIYSFEYDDDLIYAAFMSQYKIDLNSIRYLHWWKFKAMFKALNEENEIVKIMQYRSTDVSKIKDKDQKAFYKKMQKLHELPKYNKDELKKLNEISKALLNGEDVKGMI